MVLHEQPRTWLYSAALFVGSLSVVLALPRFWPESVWLVGVYAAALVALDFFDISLPRGDFIDMSSPIAVGLVVIAGPLLTLGCVVASGAISLLARRDDAPWTRSMESTVARSAAVAAAAVVYVLVGRPMPPTRETDFLLYGQLALVALTLVGVEFLVNHALTAGHLGERAMVLLASGLRLQRWVLMAQVSVGVLSVVVLHSLRYWGLALLIAMLLVMRQSLVLLLQIRHAYSALAHALVRAMEAQVPESEGHAERVADTAAVAGRRLGYSAELTERVRYAALFHDLGMFLDLPGVDLEAGHDASLGILEGVSPILRLMQSPDTASDHTAEAASAAYLIAACSDLDEFRANRLLLASTRHKYAHLMSEEERRTIDIQLGLVPLPVSAKGGV